MIGDLPATSESLVALDRGLGQGPAETRSTLRASLANLVRRADASALKKFFETTPTDREAALDKLRATQPVWQRFPDPTRKLLATVWTEEADFSTRYLASEPLAELARLGDGDAVERLSNLLTKDGDPTMRTRAAQVAGPVAALWDALRGAVDDPEPRVRQAAVVSLTVRPQVGAQRTIAKRLAAEPWTFVRLAGIQALGLLPKTSEGELALAKGLEDKAAAMRLAALLALSTHGPGRHGEAIRRVAQDQEEDVPVRAEAMRALGATCVTSALDELTSWAQQGLAPDASETARELSLGAMEGLAYLRPKNLRQRIANGLDSKTPAPMRQATERVLKLAGRCGNT
jgi:hypothetical protein